MNRDDSVSTLGCQAGFLPAQNRKGVSPYPANPLFLLTRFPGLESNKSITPNDVLRALFALKKKEQSPPPLEGKAPLIMKGVAFPHGTEFRATHKNKVYSANVQDGALLLNGQKYYSPSNAAGAITGNPVNGWIFWECKMPGSQEWKLIKLLRPR